MNIGKNERVLFSLDVLMEREGYVCSGDIFARTLNIKRSTLKVYLSDLAREGSLVRDKKQYLDSFPGNIVITEEGKKVIEDIADVLGRCQFTPERHNIPSCVNFMDLFNRLKDPLERIFLLTLYSKKFSFDLNEYLGNISTANNDSNIIAYFRELVKMDGQEELKPLKLDIYNMSVYGDHEGSRPNMVKELDEKSINSLLILAETQRKQGHLEFSEANYRQILSLESSLNQNQWFIANLGLVRVIRRKGDLEKANEFLDTFKMQTKEKVYLGIISLTEGIHQWVSKEYERSIATISSSIKSFHNLEVDLFTSLAYNMRGVDYFCMKRYEDAEKDWKKARKYAKLAESDYMEASILPNLSDIAILEGKFNKAKAYLDRAFSIFGDKNDLEGLSVTEFNYALYHIARGDGKKASESMLRSETVADPLPDQFERRLRREEFEKRARGASVKV